MDGQRRAAVLLLVCSTGCASTQKPASVLERREYEVSSDSIMLHVWTQGPTDAANTLVVLSGGAGLSHDYMDPVRALVGPDLRFVTFDQRAVGRSGSPPMKDGKFDPATFRIDDYIADLDAVLNSLPRTRIHLLGHSWGGFYALAYTARRPDKIASLILVDSLVPDSKTAEEGIKRFSARQKQLQALQLIPDPIPKAVGDDCMPNIAAKLPAYFSDPSLPIDPEFKATKCRSGVNGATFQALGEWDITKDLAVLTLPVLVVFGANDPFGGREWADDIAQALTHARVTRVILPVCGHFPQSECPEPFFITVRQFLKSSRI